MSQLATILSGNIPNNEIWYTTKNGSVLRQTDNKSTFRNGLKGHQYKNSKGVLSYNTTLLEIPDFFFYNCPELEFIVLPSSITIMGCHAFYGCESLSGVIVNDINFWFNIEFKDYLSNPLYYGHDLYLNGELVSDIVVPESILDIKDFAFERCTSLKNIELNNVKTIGRCAFEGCTSFETITLPSTLSIVEDGAFSNLYGNTFSIEKNENIPSSKMEDETVKYIEKDNVYYEWKETGYYKVIDATDSNENNTKLVTKVPSEKILDESIKYLDLTTFYTWGRYVLISSIPSDSTDENTETVNVIPTKQKEGITYLIKDNLYYQWVNKYIALNGVPEDASVENTKIVNTIPNNKVDSKLYIRTQNLYTWGKYKEIINTPYDSNVDNTLNVISLPSFNISTYKDDLYIKVDGISLEWVEKRDVIIGDNIFEDNVNAYFKTSANTTDDNSISLSIIPSKRIICENIKYLFFNDLYYKWVNDKYQFITNKPEDSVIGLKTIKINSKSTHFGFDCFKDDKNLETVIVNDVDYWFNHRFDNILSNPIYYAHDITYNNKIVTNIHVPNKLKTINDFAFYNNSSLSSLTFDADGALERIGKSAFQNCTELSSITLSNNINSVGENAFENTAWFNNQKSNTIRIDLHNGEKVLYYVKNDPYNITVSDCVIADGAVMNKEKLILISIGNDVKHIGKNSFYNCPNLKMITFESNIKTIGLDAFKNCENIVSVKFNDLGAWCNIKFDNPLSNPLFYCSNLFINNENTSTLDIPDSNSISNYAFYNCKCIEKVSLPSNITLDKIGGQSFYGCINLKTVLNPNDFVVTRGGEDCGYVARYADKVLNNADIEGNFVFNKNEIDGEIVYKLIEYLGNETEITLPDNYKDNKYTLSKLAFENNDKIEKIIFSNGVNDVENDVFCNCKSLIEVDLSATNLKTISKGAFRNCINLSKITLPETIVNIDNLAFSHCFSLTNITLPENLEFIGKEAFNNCYKITTLTIPNKVSKIEESAFEVNENYKSELNLVINKSLLVIERGSVNHGYIGYYPKKVINSPNGVIEGDFMYHTIDGKHYLDGYIGNETEINLPNTYNNKNYSIANNAFKDYEITKIVLSSGVTTIGDYAFCNCEKLGAVTFGNNVTSIGKYSFSNCSSISSLTFTEKITSFGNNAFADCKNLKQLTFKQKTLTSDIDAFKNCEKLNRVNINNIEKWCNFNFSNFASNPLYYAKNIYNSNSKLTSLSLTSNIINPYTFVNCVNITSITINDSATKIGDYAFYGCKQVNDFTINSKIESIGEYTFKGCDNLKTVINFSGLYVEKQSEQNGFVGYYADKVVNIKNGVKSDDFIFVTENDTHKLSCYLGNSDVVKLPLNYNNKSYVIAENTFINNKLTDIEFTSGVTAIEDNAFENCVNLTGLSLSNNIEYIGCNAFSGCVSIKEINFGEKPLIIKNNAFYKCCNIENVNVKSLENWCKNKYYNLYSNPMYCSDKNVINNVIGNNLVIPNTITNISQYTFAGCKSVTSVTIPSTVVKIETGVFNACTSIEKVIINEKVSHNPVNGDMICDDNCTCLETNCKTYENNEWYSLFYDNPLKTIELKRDVKDGLHEVGTFDVYYSWEDIAYKLVDNKPIDSNESNTKEVFEIPKEKVKSDTIKYLALNVSDIFDENRFEYYQWVSGYKFLSNKPEYTTITNTLKTNTLPTTKQDGYTFILVNNKYYAWWDGAYIDLTFKPHTSFIGNTLKLNNVPTNKVGDENINYICVDDKYYTYVDNKYKLVDNQPNDAVIANTSVVTTIPSVKINAENIRYIKVSEKYYEWNASNNRYEEIIKPTEINNANHIVTETIFTQEYEDENIKYIKVPEKYYEWNNVATYYKLANKPSNVQFDDNNHVEVGVPLNKVSNDDIVFIKIIDNSIQEQKISYYSWNNHESTYVLIKEPVGVTEYNTTGITITLPTTKNKDYFIKNLKDEKGNTISTYYKWKDIGYIQLPQKPDNIIIDFNTKIVNSIPNNWDTEVTYLKYNGYFYKWFNEGYKPLYDNMNAKFGNIVSVDEIIDYKMPVENIDFIKSNNTYYSWWDLTPSYVKTVLDNKPNDATQNNSKIVSVIPSTQVSDKKYLVLNGTYYTWDESVTEYVQVKPNIIVYGDTIVLNNTPKEKINAKNINYIKVGSYYYQWINNWGMYSYYTPSGAVNNSITVSTFPNKRIENVKYIIYKNVYYVWKDVKYVMALPSDESGKGIETNVFVVENEVPVEQIADIKDMYLEVIITGETHDTKTYYQWFNNEYIKLNNITVDNKEIVTGNSINISYLPSEKYYDDNIEYLMHNNHYYTWYGKYKPLNQKPTDSNEQNTDIVTEIPTSQVQDKKYLAMKVSKYASTVPAFYGNKTLSNVVIGKEVKEIDAQMFRNCDSLTSITIPDTVKVLGEQSFMGCKNLRYVIIGEGITTIPKECFKDCNNLLLVIIGSNVTTINENAFYNCVSLHTVVNNAGLPLRLKYTDYGCVSCYANKILDRQSNVNIVDDFVFTTLNNQHTLIDYVGNDYEITLPNNYNEQKYNIGEKAFYDSYGNTRFVDSISTEKNKDYNITYVVKDNVYYKWDDTKSYRKIPYTPEDISENETNLTRLDVDVIIPDDFVTTYLLKNDVYYKWNGIYKPCAPYGLNANNSIVVNTLPSVEYKEYKFIILEEEGIVKGYYKWVDNTYISINEKPSDAIIGLTKVTLGSNVESVGISAFENCLDLQSVTLNNGLKYIEDNAFKHCCNVTKVSFPTSLLTIGNNAFQKCEKLTHVYFNSGLSIGFNAFSDCTSLKYAVIDDTSKWFNMIFDSPMSNPLFYANKLYKLKDGGDLTSITTLTSPEGIIRINDYLFYNYQSLLIFQVKNEITEIGSNAFNGCIKLTALLNLQSSNVTRIGNYAFNNCTKIKQITLGEKINNIGIGAFNKCTSLTNITFDGTNSSEILKLSYNHYSLKNGKGLLFDCPLTNITLNRNIQYENSSYCGISPFANITTLTNITINNNVSVIPENAFYGCVNITKVIVNDLNKWCEIEFKTKESNPTYYANNITYNDNVVKNINLNSASKIGNYCFYNCKDLTAITINNNVSYIGVEAFKNCENLENLNIGNSSTIKTIGSYAFENCQKIKTFDIPNEIQNINKGVFKDCTALTSITINDNINKIGYDAFNNCTSLTNVKTNNLLKWMQIEFYNEESNPLFYAKKLMLNNNEVTGITTNGDSFNKINSYCFYNCTGLTNLIITSPTQDGAGIINIGNSAFEGCTNLSKVTIANTVTDIANRAFNGCKKLNSVTIGNNISRIGDNAFTNTSVDKVYIKAKTPPIVKDKEIPFENNTTFYVPLKNKKDYENSNYWKNQKNINGYNF